MTKLTKLFTMKTNLTTKKPHLAKSCKTVNKNGFLNKQCKQLSRLTEIKDGNYCRIFF